MFEARQLHGTKQRTSRFVAFFVWSELDEGFGPWPHLRQKQARVAPSWLEGARSPLTRTNIETTSVNSGPIGPLFLFSS